VDSVFQPEAIYFKNFTKNMLLVSDCLSVTCPINPRHRNVGKLMVLLNVFHELMVTPPGAKFSAVMTGMDLVLYEHLPTSPCTNGPWSVAWLDICWRVVANKSAWTFNCDKE
jgi:hypothetical protein